MSYRKKHIKSKIHKIKPKKSVLRSGLFWLIILILAIIIAGVYFFLFYPGVQIKNIIISGNQRVATNDIENFISADISNKILGIAGLQIVSKSIFLMNNSRLSEAIVNKFPTIESVEITKNFFKTIIFKVNERISTSIFCPSLDGEKSNCYLMDSSGTVFESVRALPENMLVVRKLINKQIFIGEKVVQQSIIDLILKVEKNLRDSFKINLSEALIASSARLNLKTSENWQIYLNLNENYNIESQLLRLNLLLNGGISANERKNLRYIDLRAKDKAIICDNATCGNWGL